MSRLRLASPTTVLAGAALVAMLGVATIASTATAQDVTRGEEVFIANCAVCHGSWAQGRMGPPLNQIPPELAAAPLPVVAEGLTGLIRNGIPGRMPGFTPGQVADEDVIHLVAYLFANAATPLPSPSFYEALAPVTAATVPGRTYYAQTNHSVGGAFRDFYLARGGSATFGYPLTEEYWGVTPGGELRLMQLFERARLELDANLPRGQQVQLGTIGTEERELRTQFARE